MKCRQPAFVRMVVWDTLVWLGLHLAIAYATTQLPRQRFDYRQWLFRCRSWERHGTVYERWLGVNQWKRMLPDGALLFRKGFGKKHLEAGVPNYIYAFVRETCRAELTHWLVIAASPLFLLWHRWKAEAIMLIYALAANLPCIVVQRYNRPRLVRLASRAQAHGMRG